MPDLIGEVVAEPVETHEHRDGRNRDDRCGDQVAVRGVSDHHTREEYQENDDAGTNKPAA